MASAANIYASNVRTNSHGGSQYDGTPDPGQQGKDPAAHQRTYQACIPCRNRKVRCDLGSVDNPSDPPCLRCKRESKECYFSSTRRKKKKSGIGDGAEDSDEEVPEAKHTRKRARQSPDRVDEEEAEEEPRTPGGSLGRRQPLRRPHPQKPVQYTEEDHQASEHAAAMLQSSEVHGGHDALKVLYHVAYNALPRDRNNSGGSLERPSFNSTSPLLPAGMISPRSIKHGNGNSTDATSSRTPLAAQAASRGRHNTNTSHPSFKETTTIDRNAIADSLKAWSRFRFVREGWFTAQEAIDYIQYFYKYLAPLTPVALPTFSPHSAHERMLTQEPMLTITILLIASRHMKLSGPGSISRPYEIHKRLWSYLQGMINRVVWGQEQFGGGYCGAGSTPAGSVPASDMNPLARKGLRTLGTVESLVLLTEWHPRMMHFPPDEADAELMLPDEPVSTPVMIDEDDVPKGIGGQRMDTWLEPVWRSDRMCWMLLGMAMSLAFEVGVFDASDWQRHARTIEGQPLSPGDLQTYDKRRGSVRDLLLVYVTQTSGRLGLTTVLPTNYSKPEDSNIFDRKYVHHASQQETIMHFWLRMAAIIREGNSSIFANKTFTRDLIKNGEYGKAIQQLSAKLNEWRQDFERCLTIPKHMRAILMIEYEYCRVYTNALALQAVAERCANEQPLNVFENPAVEIVRENQNITTNGLRSDAPISPHALAKWLGGDRTYMLEVGDAARNLLKIVVEDLYPEEYLRHAPVRTYFRIISVAIILLKSFSLGASESDVADSLNLMDRTIDALQTCIVDDVHVASRFAELLSRLSESLKPRLVRITADGRVNRSTRASMPGTPVPMSMPGNDMHSRAYVQQMQQAMAGATMAMPQQQQQQHQQWTYGNTAFDNTVNNGYNNPLLGISSDAYDLTGNDFSVMPPPTYMQSPTNTHGLNGTNGAQTTGGGAYDPVYGTNTYGGGVTAPEDWLTLPLDGLFGSNGAVIEQTMWGPQIGDHDMLEVLLNGQIGGNGFGA
ncbi:zinc finger transcriptional activator [Recurvomyces mirabilis]|uniref:Zinc finger transcriptional activator n=1 Tax=Recurvomyces mirabilis TaxID=574656 RepID=A0AAE0WY16_9PEZI|nr:zinc finger transcriptional activator [Recurvomyces mirabilis]KAK5162125.1 zinc finger transcriptional activator [Recurvomyces mirabilis]